MSYPVFKNRHSITKHDWGQIKTVLSLGLKGEHKSLSAIQKDKNKVPLDFKMTVSHGL